MEIKIEKRGMRVNFSLEAPPAGHVVVTPKTAEWMAARDAFVEKWVALQKEGLRQGFLEYGLCFECAGTVEPTTDFADRVWVPEGVAQGGAK